MNAIVRLVPPLMLTVMLWPAAAPAQGVAEAQPPHSVDSGGQWTQEAEAFSVAELEQLLAPIALYPDVLLSQVLVAATYPLEIVEAARWSRDNPGLRGEEAVNAVSGRDWDPSVMALVAFPDLLARMSDDLGWTRDVGDAFLYQEGDVIDAVQTLRRQAHAAGHLESTEHVRVVHEERVIHVQPANPRVVYVPYYDPLVVYGGWRWSAYRPYHWAPPPVYHRHASFYWSYGVPVSAGFFFSTLNWHARHVVVVHNHVHLFPSRPSLRHYDVWPRWRHNPVHRRGVVYRHHAVHSRYVGDSDARAGRAQRREVAGAMSSGVRSGSLAPPRQADRPRGQRSGPTGGGERAETRSGSREWRGGADRRRDAGADTRRGGESRTSRPEPRGRESRADVSRAGGVLQSGAPMQRQGDARRRADAPAGQHRSPRLSGRGDTAEQSGDRERRRDGGQSAAGRAFEPGRPGVESRSRSAGAQGAGRSTERHTLLRGSNSNAGAPARSAPNRQATRPAAPGSRASDTAQRPAAGNRAGGTRSSPNAPSLSGSRTPSISRGTPGTGQGLRSAQGGSQGGTGSSRSREQRRAR